MMPSCFSYGYISTMSDNRPDATLTHVQCHESAGFGEMFPFPPELFTSTTDAAPSPSNATGIEVQPIDGGGDDSSSSSSSSASAGVIAGAAVGVVALLLLIALAVFLIVRRRRQKKAGLEATGSTMALPPRDKESGGGGDGGADGGGGGGQKQKQRLAPGMGRLRPLSTIPEQPSPISTRPLSSVGAAAAAAATSTSSRRKSLRRSFGPHWPLGSGNPLAAHPVSSNPTHLSTPRISRRKRTSSKRE